LHSAVSFSMMSRSRMNSGGLAGHPAPSMASTTCARIIFMIVIDG